MGARREKYLPFGPLNEKRIGILSTEFTLHLSPEAISLASRRSDDAWEIVVRTAPDAEDLSAAFAQMKSLIEAKDNAQVLVIVPREQVLFTSCEAPDEATPTAERRAVEAKLDGLTPYELSELQYDWLRTDSVIQIAAIAAETIQAAQEFIKSYGITAVALTVETLPDDYDGTPIFRLAKRPKPTPHVQNLATIPAPKRKIRLEDIALFVPHFRKGMALGLGGGIAVIVTAFLLMPSAPEQDVTPEAPAVVAATPPVAEPAPSAPVASGLPAPDVALMATPPTLTAPRPRRDGTILAAIDPILTQQDALALRPPLGGIGDDAPPPILSPIPFGTGSVLNSAGLVDPTPEGALNPDGVLVFDAAPPVAAIPRPDAILEAARAARLEQIETLAGTLPRLRPENFAEILERQQLNGFTRSELSSITPQLRPASLQEIAEAARAAEAAALAVSEGRSANQALISDLAVARSLLPQARPSGFEAVVAAATPASAAAPNGVAAEAAAQSGADEEIEAEIAAVSTDTPSGERVTRAATNRNAINLRDTNLIGVTGPSSSRRALVRLPSGRFVTVEVGDRLDGGRVAAIGDDSLQYIKDGENITLEVPNG